MNMVIESLLFQYDVLNIYLYGSRVYGIKTYGDYDFIVVVEGENIETQYLSEELDITIMSRDVFEIQLGNHEISELECIFLPDHLKFKEKVKFDFELDRVKLRHSISAITSNSFGKCKKKIIDGEVYIGKKSMFHSLRIGMFGIQIAKYGQIVDYSCANRYWYEIMDMPNDGDIIKQEYKPIRNGIMTEFRQLCPKE